MKIKKLIILLAMIAGCGHQNEIRIQPIILHKDWDINKLQKQITYAKNTFAITQTYLHFLPIIYNTEIKPSILVDEDWSFLVFEAEQHVFKHKNIPVYFVDKILWGSDLKPYDGLSILFEENKPRYGVSVANDSSVDTLAHELGHQFGLEHTFDLKISDPDYCRSDDCLSLNCKHNLMGYCNHSNLDDNGLSLVNYNLLLTEKQIETINRNLKFNLLK